MFVVFFFQAEDGIRDGRVTGVQTCALPIYSRTLAGECVGEYGTKGARETGVRGRVRRVLRRREYGMDARICLWGPDEPVVVLGIEASDERVEAGRAHNEQNPCGLRVRAAVGNDQLARDSHEGSLGPRRLVHVPVVRNVDLLLGPGVRDLTNLGQRRIEGIASKCRWRSRPQLILGREQEGPRAEVAACDGRRRSVDPVARSDRWRSDGREQWIGEPNEVALREGE